MWCFYSSHGQFGRPDWAMKPVQMLQQEAAVIVALGGNVQTCENPFGGVRTGRLIPWRMKRIGELARFVKRRRELCQDTETIPQVAVLHSEHHACATAQGGNLLGSIDVRRSRAPSTACSSVITAWIFSTNGRCCRGWRSSRSSSCRSRTHVRADGRCPEGVRPGRRQVAGLRARRCSIVSAASSWASRRGRLVEKAIYYVPAADGTVPISQRPWRLVETGKAESLATLGTTPLRDEQLLPNPAATLNRVGRGAVAYIPCNVFREFTASRYPPLRVFLHDVLRALAGPMEIEVGAPTCVDVVLRRQGEANRPSHQPFLRDTEPAQ